MQEKKIKKELLKLQEIYHTFQPENHEKFSDLIELEKEKFKKCETHQKVNYFFCENHRETGLMCNDCCEDHVKQGKDKIKQSDLDCHNLFYFPNYLLKEIDSQITDLYKTAKYREKVNNICESISNNRKFIDYNYYFVNKIVDAKFEEIEEFLKEYKKEVKDKIKQKYKIYVKYKFKFKKSEKDFGQNFWFKSKENLSDEFYNVYNTVINKLCSFNIDFNNIVKNSHEKVNRENPVEDCKLEHLDLSSFEANFKERVGNVPKYNCAFINVDKIKQTIKENIYIFEEILKEREARTLKENIANDKNFLENQKKIHFFLDSKYSFRINDIAKGKYKKESTKINILTKNNENLDEINFSHIFPINAAKLNLNEFSKET